ncbi:MAG TPA: 8-oxo-dGTP diphosphatase MutT [Lentisphaeria bacterium]|nr:8-oxo-dGTP diphosphatase MutT [Lentisphaeria bacterium]HCG47657.1 8-oxo-dGTP diphosphatase MutT [Lentisphaeria bacterium]
MRKPIINVCGAVIRRGSKILICGRAPGTKLAGYKEFPGGKAEPGETLSECLRREIREELGTEIYTLDTAYQAWVELPDRIFHLHFIRSVIQDGAPEPSPQENQSMEWLETAELDSVNMLPADVGIAKLLAESARKTAES